MMESVSRAYCKKWSAIVLTCQNKRSSYSFQKELEIHKSAGFIESDVLTLVLEDLKEHVGSGGATLNALMVVAEHLSAQAGYVTLTTSVLEGANILILHMGRDYIFGPCGRAFTCLPAKYSNKPMTTLCDGLVSTLECLLYIVSDIISSDAPPGVWACSTDVLLSVSPSTKINWHGWSSGITMFVTPVEKDYARLHGVAKLDAQGEVEDIIFHGTEQDVNRCVLEGGKVPVVSGVVFFSPAVTDKLLVLHAYPPLDACTYYGLDNGAPPIQLSLFFDILLCMAKGVSENDFVCGTRSGAYGRSTYTGTEKIPEDEQTFMRGARALLWQHLHGIKLRAVVFEKGNFDYMEQSGVCYRRQMLQSAEFLSYSGLRCSPANHTHVYMKKGETGCPPVIDGDAIVLNSIVEGGVEGGMSIGRGSVVTHCHLNGDLTLGSGMILSGIESSDLEALPRNLTLPDDMCILGFNVSLPSLRVNVRKILVVFGVHDKLQLAASSHGSTFCNRPWNQFFEETGISSEELWVHGLPEEKRSLYNARLFPVVYPFENISEQASGSDLFWFVSSKVEKVTPSKLERWRSSLRFSMKEILSVINLDAEFDWKRQLWFQIGKQDVESSLHSCENKCHLPFFRSCTNAGFETEILETLDAVICTTSSPGVAARTLACIADVLGAMAGEKAGLRSGPARNEAWMQAFRYLETKNLLTGVKALADKRSQWLNRPDLLIRAARHYEGAEQILRRHAVMTAREFVSVRQCEPIPIGHWVVADAPARADLAGGWTDTPPVTYEHGGSVLNVAIKLNGKRPVVAKVRKIPELEIRLVIQTKEHTVRVTCKELSDLSNYTQPHAPGALLKACFCVVDVVTFPSDQSLADQLRERYNAGFELHTLSDNIPRGSGLGTSSILAGVILGAILRAAGRTASVDSLIHAVLLVEQMLTTAGGWQDNVGGLVPGFKICRAKACLPLKVETERLDVSPAIVEDFLKRLVFVYTGKTRLAKNLLQDVVRNWYARLPEIARNTDKLKENAEEAAQALVDGDLKKFGKCLNNYRHQKKTMAPGTEPDEISKMMKLVEPYCLGQALAGAGGGGFLYILVKEPSMLERVKSVLQGLEFYDVSIDYEGLTIRVEEP